MSVRSVGGVVDPHGVANYATRVAQRGSGRQQAVAIAVLRTVVNDPPHRAVLEDIAGLRLVRTIVK